MSDYSAIISSSAHRKLCIAGHGKTDRGSYIAEILYNRRFNDYEYLLDYFCIEKPRITEQAYAS